MRRMTEYFDKINRENFNLRGLHWTFVRGFWIAKSGFGRHSIRLSTIYAPPPGYNPILGYNPTTDNPGLAHNPNNANPGDNQA